MAPKRNHGGSSRAARELNRAEEWVGSISNEVALNRLVEDDVLPDRAMAVWHLAWCKSFLTPHGDELLVFEDYFHCGFCVPIHPCNTLGVKHVLNLDIAWAQASLSIHEHEHIMYSIYVSLYCMCYYLIALLITTKNPSFYDNNPHDGRNYCHIIYHNMTQKSVVS